MLNKKFVGVLLVILIFSKFALNKERLSGEGHQSINLNPIMTSLGPWSLQILFDNCQHGKFLLLRYNSACFEIVNCQLYNNLTKHASCFKRRLYRFKYTDRKRGSSLEIFSRNGMSTSVETKHKFFQWNWKYRRQTQYRTTTAEQLFRCLCIRNAVQHTWI